MKKPSRKNRIAFPIKLFSEKGEINLAEDNVREIHVVPVGKWTHWSGEDFEITPEKISEIVRHFNEGARKDLPITAGHDIGFSSGELPAVGWFRELIDRGANGLYASVEWTKEGLKLLEEHAFKYFSAELAFDIRDLETDRKYDVLLTGGALTNKPFFKQLDKDPSFGFSDEDRAKSETIFDLSVPEIINQFNDSNNMDLNTILAKPVGEWSDDEKAFVRENQADLSDEQREAAKDVLAEGEGDSGDGDGDGSQGEDGDGSGAGDGGDGEGSGEGDGEGGDAGDGAGSGEGDGGNVNASETGKVEISLAELNTLRSQANQGAKAFTELEKMRIKERFSGLVLSSSNKNGKFAPKQQDAVVGFMSTLSEQQRDQFTEIIKNMPKTTLEFGERGEDNGSESDAAKQINLKIEEKRKDNKDLSYSEALRVVLRENPDLEKAYNEEGGKEDE